LGLTAGAGYSGVLFGWLMIYAMQEPLGSTSVFSLAVPNLVLPFLYLFATQLLIRRVSFIGHLSGIVIGLIIALAAFRWFDHYLLLSSIIWLTLLTLWNIKTTSDFPLTWLSLTSPAMPSMRVRDGQMIHANLNNSSNRDRDRDRTSGRESRTPAT
jgi:membrane associated rhomboid family serine protease